MAGVIFTDRAAARVAQAVRWVERHRSDSGSIGAPASEIADTVWVRVTSDTPTDGLYPGKINVWNEATDAWEEVNSPSVWLRPANEETLAEDVYYPARPVGMSSGGTEVYLTVQGPPTSIGIQWQHPEGSNPASVTWSNVRSLAFDEFSYPAGWYVWAWNDGRDVRVALKAASEANPGIVTSPQGINQSDIQVFRGIKKFATGLICVASPFNGDMALTVTGYGGLTTDLTYGLKIVSFGDGVHPGSSISVGPTSTGIIMDGPVQFRGGITTYRILDGPEEEYGLGVSSTIGGLKFVWGLLVSAEEFGGFENVTGATWMGL